MAEEAEWAAYLYPGTNILRNKLGIQDERIYEAEAFLVGRRAEQLRAGLVEIPRTLDAEQLKAIHFHLGRDLYSWSGEFRTVSLGKRTVEGEPARWFLPPKAIAGWLDEVTADARQVAWSDLPRAELVKETAQLYGYLNLGHSFREINGRASRIFLEQTIEGSPFTLNFNQVETDEWNEASRDSIAPGRSSSPAGPLDFAPLERVFGKIVVDRDATPPTAARSNLLQRVQDLTEQTSIQRGGGVGPGGDYRPGPAHDRGPSL